MSDADSLDLNALRTLTASGTSWSGAGEERPAVDELVGRTLNATYKVEAVLGEGGMGRVYRARHTRIASKLYAIKVLHREYGADPQVLARFQREAEAAASITHSNVVGVYDVDRTSRGLPYLVCEYLAGMDMSEYLRKHGRLDADAAVHIALQVCEGVEAAHAQGVLHRDLKPHNVFLCADSSGEVPERPTVKLLDFGLSRFLDGSSSELTRAGVIMGTPAFMAPEQARGERSDHRLDVYGLGTILYTALSGRVPFNEESPQATILAVLRKSPVPLQTLVPTIPLYLQSAVERAMAKLPDERFATMRELREALVPVSSDPEPDAAQIVRVSETPGAAGLQLDGGAAPADRLARLGFTGRVSTLKLAGATLLANLVALTMVTVAVSGVPAFVSAPSLLRLLPIVHILAVVATALAFPLLVNWWWRRSHQGPERTDDLRRSLQRVLLSSLLAFAVGALTIRLAAVFAAPRIDLLGLDAEKLKGWPGWNLLLTLVAFIAGAGSAIGATLRPGAGWWRRFASDAVELGGVAACATVLVWGMNQTQRWTHVAERASSQSVDGSQEALGAASLALDPVLVDGDIADEPEAPSTTTPSDAPRASEEELAAAIEDGEQALVALAGKYPDDVKVLRKLAFVFASRAAALPDTMAVVKHLFSVEPSSVTDPELRYFVSRAAETPGPAADQAFDILENHMGTAGPDLLYELLLRSKASDSAQAMLNKPSLRERFSPELAIAFDLRSAQGCAARLPLLKRASMEGDERSIMVLAALSSGTRRGCGKWKRHPCKPACPDEAQAFRDAIKSISVRVNGAEQK